MAIFSRAAFKPEGVGRSQTQHVSQAAPGEEGGVNDAVALGDGAFGPTDHPARSRCLHLASVFQHGRLTRHPPDVLDVVRALPRKVHHTMTRRDVFLHGPARRGDLASGNVRNAACCLPLWLKGLGAGGRY
jgi:hypothetical protein